MSAESEKLRKEAEAEFKKAAEVLKKLNAAKPLQKALVASAEKMKKELEKLPE